MKTKALALFTSKVSSKIDGQSRNYLNQFAKILSGSLLGQLILIAVSPLLTRMYSPEDFGTLAFYTNLFGVLSVAASLRMELAIPQARSGREATQLTLLSLYSGVFLALIAAIVACGWWVWKPGPLSIYWWTVPIGVVLMGASNALTAWGAYYRLAKVVGRSRIMQAVESVAVQVAWPFISHGPLGLILGTLVSQGGGVTRLGRMFGGRIKRRVSVLEWAPLWRLLNRMRAFPLIVTPASLVGRAAVHAPIPLFLFLYGPKLAGLLLLSQRLIGLPTILLGRAATVPFQQALGRAHRRKQSAMGVFLLTLGAFAVPGVGMLAVILLFGPDIFKLVFGPKWIEAGDYARVLAPMFFFQLLASPFAQAQAVSNRALGQLVTESIRLLVVLLAVFIPHYFGMTINMSLLIYSIAMCGIYSIYIFSAAKSSVAQQGETK